MGDARTQRHSAHPAPLTGRASSGCCEPLCEPKNSFQSSRPAKPRDVTLEAVKASPKRDCRPSKASAQRTARRSRRPTGARRDVFRHRVPSPLPRWRSVSCQRAPVQHQCQCQSRASLSSLMLPRSLARRAAAACTARHGSRCTSSFIKPSFGSHREWANSVAKGGCPLR